MHFSLLLTSAHIIAKNTGIVDVDVIYKHVDAMTIHSAAPMKPAFAASAVLFIFLVDMAILKLFEIIRIMTIAINIAEGIPK